MNRTFLILICASVYIIGASGVFAASSCEQKIRNWSCDRPGTAGACSCQVDLMKLAIRCAEEDLRSFSSPLLRQQMQAQIAELQRVKKQSQECVDSLRPPRNIR